MRTEKVQSVCISPSILIGPMHSSPFSFPPLIAPFRGHIIFGNYRSVEPLNLPEKNGNHRASGADPLELVPLNLPEKKNGNHRASASSENQPKTPLTHAAIIRREQ